MTLGSILILLLLIVSLIVFIYIIVMTARSWGVLHTLLLCTLFIECWVFIVFAAGVQAKRVRYTREAAVNQKRAEDALAETNRLLYGTLTTPEDALEAVVPVKGMLRRLTADRGRVWRQLAFLQANNNEYLLEMVAKQPAADPLDDPAAAPAAPAAVNSDSLPVDLVVYAFAEEVDEQGNPNPVFYLGEFVVTQSGANQVTLRPTLPLQSFQTDYIASNNASSWALYELLPIDSHEAFAAPGSQPDDEHLFGRMDEETIQSLFAGVQDPGLQAKIIDSYLRDGQRSAPDDDPSTLWTQVNMLKDHDVDVDSQEAANATVGGYFDSIGRSVDSRLKRDDEGIVTLTPAMNSEGIVLKRPAAEELIRSGAAELVQNIFVRPLNDYEEAFNRNYVRQHEVAERITLVKRESAEITKANALGNEMLQFRQEEKQKLTADLSGFQQEIDVLNQATATATAELAALKTRLSQLFRTIQATRTEMTP